MAKDAKNRGEDKCHTWQTCTPAYFGSTTRYDASIGEDERVLMLDRIPVVPLREIQT